MLMQVELDDCSEISGATFEGRRYYFFASVFVGELGSVRLLGMPFEYTIEGGVELDRRLEGSPDASVYRRALGLIDVSRVESEVLCAESWIDACARTEALRLVV